MMQQQSLTPQGGVASLGNRQDIADKLANMGQFDDDQIAHVAEGEVIVPAPIMKYYPEIREQVFDVLRREGLDPQEFVVGGDLVALNPQTGMQEFGFLSKIFKKVKKAFKKLAPIILAVALPGIGTALGAGSMFGYATVGQAALTGAAAGGIGGLIQGKSFKDSLKMAALGGLTAGAFKGVGNKFAGRGFFDSGAGQAVSTAAQSGMAATDPIVTVGKDGLINVQPITGDVATGSRLIGDGIVGSPQTSLTYTSPGYDPTTFAKTVADKQGIFNSLKPSNIAKNLGIGGGPSTPAGITDAYTRTLSGGAAERGLLSKVPDALVPKNPTDLVNLAGLTMVGAGLLGGEEEGGGQNLVDYEPYEPEGGVFTGLGYNPETGRFENVRLIRPTDFERAAAGGAISGPGTGTSDSIPAMLSDGEFVMTAKAVRGMGDGSRKKGAAQMYQMMNKLESMA